MERRRPAADGISRLLSLIAIVLTGGSSLFFYQENRNLKAELAADVQTGEDVDGQAIYKEHAEKWDQALTGALNQFNDKATDYLKDFDAARTARDAIAEEAIRLSREDVAQIVKQQLDERVTVMRPVVEEPELRLANPVNLINEDAPIMIANDGDLEAEIISVTFRPLPDTQFETSLPPEPDENQIVIRFSSEDNKPTKANHHRLYQRSFLGQNIAAGDTVKISVEISNNKHVDWGMEGELRVQYSGGRELVIPSVPAVFVPEKTET